MILVQPFSSRCTLNCTTKSNSRRQHNLYSIHKTITLKLVYTIPPTHWGQLKLGLDSSNYFRLPSLTKEETVCTSISYKKEIVLQGNSSALFCFASIICQSNPSRDYVTDRYVCQKCYTLKNTPEAFLYLQVNIKKNVQGMSINEIHEDEFLISLSLGDLMDSYLWPITSQNRQAVLTDHVLLWLCSYFSFALCCSVCIYWKVWTSCYFHFLIIY